MSKFALMIIGTIAIGMFALPGVISTFTGSHDYVAPENVDCAKCHPEVYDDLLNSVDNHTHAGYTNTDSNIAWTLDCVECHTVSGVGDNPAVGHAAQKVNCAFCHDNSSFVNGQDSYSKWAHDPSTDTGLLYKYDMECNACHRDNGMPQDNNMFLDDVFQNIVHPDAAHNGFFNDAVLDDTLLGPSEACVGCHTHVEFTMNGTAGSSTMTYDRDTGVFGTE